MSKYVCIECGACAPELYKDYNGGIIKISHCEKCEKVVDKYVEYDPVIIFLDALLHKPQAYRHIILNTDAKFSWQLVIIYLFCDTYMKWVHHHTHATPPDSPSSPPSNSKEELLLFYAAVEGEIYRHFIAAALEFVVTIGCLLLMVSAVTRLFHQSNSMSFKVLLKGIIISSFAKLMVIPALIWGQTDSAIYLWMTRLLLFTSNVQALKVIGNYSRLLAVGVISAVHIAPTLLSGLLNSAHPSLAT